MRASKFIESRMIQPSSSHTRPAGTVCACRRTSGRREPNRCCKRAGLARMQAARKSSRRSPFRARPSGPRHATQPTARPPPSDVGRRPASLRAHIQPRNAVTKFLPIQIFLFNKNCRMLILNIFLNIINRHI